MGREPTFPLAFRHTWSLAIEEQFYIFWPVMIWIVGRRGLPAMALAIVGVAVTARAWGVNHFILITRCDGLALGGLLAGLIGERARAHQMSSRSRARFTTLLLAAPGVVLMVLVCTTLLDAALAWSWPPPSTVDSLKMLGANLVLLRHGRRGSCFTQAVPDFAGFATPCSCI